MFSFDSPIAILIRTCTFCQLLAATALLFACQRAQLLLLSTGAQEAKNRLVNTGMNFSILIGPLILAITYPYVGKLAGVTGFIGGFFCIYMIPICTYIKHQYALRSKIDEMNDDDYQKEDVIIKNNK